jgi:hypothetical protein
MIASDMDHKKIAFFSASQKKHAKDTALLKSTENFDIDIDIAFALENKESLSVVYNKAIQHALEENWDALVFVHDDVVLEHDPRPKLVKLFEKFDLIGVAGASSVEIKTPALWHLMGGGFNSGKLHGAVAHGTSEKKQMTPFGPYPHRVVMIDGVFMAMNRTVMENVKFDESNPSKFHFYDVLFGLDACFKKLKIGVGDISITHESPGLKNFTDDWIEGEKYFLEKYSKYHGKILAV